ncbi:BrnA antitoxin family protein [Duganella sp. LX47W]|uniref:BrnA antitoxin family protein n=2 Tax=Rugamonas apoptosis TaxID=2758570 RepID=A0A7W2FEX4_9BURK|nr:BrnA antitoxin family protein [Rugamonas apoptosis]
MRERPTPERLDDENPAWTAESVAKVGPANEVLPQIFGEQMAKEMLKPRGRPRVEFPKERINIRLSQDVITYFKAAGDGFFSACLVKYHIAAKFAR